MKNQLYIHYTERAAGDEAVRLFLQVSLFIIGFPIFQPLEPATLFCQLFSVSAISCFSFSVVGIVDFSFTCR